MLKIHRAITRSELLRMSHARNMFTKFFSGTSGGDKEFWPFCFTCSCPGDGQNKSLYDARKYSPNLPQNNTCPDFPTLGKIPTDVFRNTSGECLGPQGQASKCGMYLNPEYFSFHHMTYYDMHYALRQFRSPSAKTGRKA